MKTFYLDINNDYDAERVAESADQAVLKLFPRAEKLRSIGFDDYNGQTAEIFRLVDDGEDFEVLVTEKKNSA